VIPVVGPFATSTLGAPTKHNVILSDGLLGLINPTQSCRLNIATIINSAFGRRRIRRVSVGACCVKHSHFNASKANMTNKNG